MRTAAHGQPCKSALCLSSYLISFVCAASRFPGWAMSEVVLTLHSSSAPIQPPNAGYPRVPVAVLPELLIWCLCILMELSYPKPGEEHSLISYPLSIRYLSYEPSIRFRNEKARARTYTGIMSGMQAKGAEYLLNRQEWALKASFADQSKAAQHKCAKEIPKAPKIRRSQGWVHV